MCADTADRVATQDVAGAVSRSQRLERSALAATANDVAVNFHCRLLLIESCDVRTIS
jgi:hypothetical protein